MNDLGSVSKTAFYDHVRFHILVINQCMFVFIHYDNLTILSFIYMTDPKNALKWNATKYARSDELFLKAMLVVALSTDASLEPIVLD